MKKNICRPITFYNNFIPLEKYLQDWQFCAFGTVDGIDVDNDILFDTMDQSITQRILEDQKNFCQRLQGKFAAQRIYAVRFGESQADEEFWEKEDYFPFFFFCRIQCDNGKQKVWEDRENLEKRLQLEGSIKAITYLTYDNSDLLLILRTIDYNTGAAVINA